MFPAYPGFENLPLRVEVQWRGAARPVVARLEQWPNSDKAVLVCAFEDDEADGEWIVIGSGGLIPYSFKNPSTKMQAVLQKAFGDNKNYSVARMLKLENLQQEHRIALRTSQKSSWLIDDLYQSWIEFQGQEELELSESEAHQQLLKEWEDTNSQARFAWDWSALNDAERKQKLGFVGESAELDQVMTWVLTITHFAQPNDGFIWWFGIEEETGELRGILEKIVLYQVAEQIESNRFWEQFLLSYFAAQWHADWWQKHQCVRRFIQEQSYGFGYAEIISPPTAHEQLEAKLQLRDWLQDKATPAEIEQLLAM